MDRLLWILLIPFGIVFVILFFVAPEALVIHCVVGFCLACAGGLLSDFFDPKWRAAHKRRQQLMDRTNDLIAESDREAARRRRREEQSGRCTCGVAIADVSRLCPLPDDCRWFAKGVDHTR